jgi:translocator assembly and maintenance protein 41
MDNNEIKQLITQFSHSKPDTIGIFGYGSGVNKQAGYTNKDRPQIDLIMVVNNTEKWHLENIKINPDNYSLTSKLFFSKIDSKWQHFATDICYLPYIKELGHTFKIGIISKDDLLNDLYNWESFYLAGRFQKIILPIKSTAELDVAISKNREKAITIALLLMRKKELNLYNLFKKICSLSYLGDIRMGIAENPKKLDNLVKGGYEEFKKIYSNSNLFQIDSNEKIIINHDSLYSSMEQLPKSLITHLETNNYSLEQLITLRKLLIDFFTEKNKHVSRDQAIKGFFTAGPVNSISYLTEKILKKIKK